MPSRKCLQRNNFDWLCKLRGWIFSPCLYDETLWDMLRETLEEIMSGQVLLLMGSSLNLQASVCLCTSHLSWKPLSSLINQFPSTHLKRLRRAFKFTVVTFSPKRLGKICLCTRMLRFTFVVDIVSRKIAEAEFGWETFGSWFCFSREPDKLS